jgi:hypothetical protein
MRAPLELEIEQIRRQLLGLAQYGRAIKAGAVRFTLVKLP